jgi:hypothetical protein
MFKVAIRLDTSGLSPLLSSVSRRPDKRLKCTGSKRFTAKFAHFTLFRTNMRSKIKNYVFKLVRLNVWARFFSLTTTQWTDE